MRRRGLVLVLSFIFTLAFGSAGAAAAAPGLGSSDFGSLGGIPGLPGTSAGCSAELYSPGDWRLGPKEFATEAPVGPQPVSYTHLTLPTIYSV